MKDGKEQGTGVGLSFTFYVFFFSFIFISWRLITLQYCSGFWHTLTWISHGFTCVPHPDPPSRLPPHPIPPGLPSAPFDCVGFQIQHAGSRARGLSWALYLRHEGSAAAVSRLSSPTRDRLPSPYPALEAVFLTTGSPGSPRVHTKFLFWGRGWWKCSKIIVRL